MAVLAAQAFKFLDKQTHNPVTDLSKITGSDVYNTIENGVKETSAAVKELIGSIQDKAKSMADAAKAGAKDAMDALGDITSSVRDAAGDLINGVQGGIDSLKGVMRTVMNGISSMKDFAGNAVAALEGFIASLLPAGVARSTVTSLARKCKDSMGMQNVLGKPYDVSGKCGSGGKSGCTTSSVNGLLNSLTGGLYNKAAQNINAFLSGLVGLTNLSYSANLCGAFPTLAAAISGLTGAQTTRAASSVIGTLGKNGNLLGLADMSKYATGLGIMSTLPTALSTMSKNVGSYSEKSISSVATSGLAGYELIDENWAFATNGNYSTRNVSEASDGFLNVVKAKTYDEKVADLHALDDFYAPNIYSAMASSGKGLSFDNWDIGSW